MFDFREVCVSQPSFGAILLPRPTTYKRAKRASYNLRRRASYNLGGNTPVEWHDALPFSCVMFTVPVRHQPSSFNSLSYMHTPPPIFSPNPLYRPLKVAKNQTVYRHGLSSTLHAVRRAVRPLPTTYHPPPCYTRHQPCITHDYCRSYCAFPSQARTKNNNPAAAAPAPTTP